MQVAYLNFGQPSPRSSPHSVPASAPPVPLWCPANIPLIDPPMSACALRICYRCRTEAPDNLKATPSSSRLITSAGHSRSSSSYSGLATVADVESREEPGVGLELVISGASMLKEGTGMLESFFASDAAALACAAVLESPHRSLPFVKRTSLARA